MLDLTKLRYLAAIHKYGSFTKASKALFVSQPAISSAITSLEKYLGVELLIRSTKPLTFTPAGERFVIYAEHILQECDKAEQDMRCMSAAYDETLSLGMSPTLSHHLLPYLYKSFFPQRGDSHVSISEAGMYEQIEKLKEGSLDLAYNALPDKPVEGIVTRKLTSSQLYVVLPATHPLTRLAKLDMSMLDGEPVSLTNPESRIYSLLMSEFRRRGVVPGSISYHDQIICMFDLVKWAGYISFMHEGSYLDMCRSDPMLEYRPLIEPMYLDVGFLYKADSPMPRIGRDLIRFAEETASDWLNPEGAV